jgi:uncharacterized membrane protein
MEDFQTLIIIIYSIILLSALLITVLMYNEYMRLKNGESNSTGSWHGGTFYTNPKVFIPIDDKTDSEDLQKAINNHRKGSMFFWIWLLFLIPILIFLNLNY